MSDLGKQGGGIPANEKPACEGGRPAEGDTAPKGESHIGFIAPLGPGNNHKAR